MLHVATGHGMEPMPITNVNLDTLPGDLVIEIGYFLDAENIDTLRCVNKACQEKVVSQEELNKNLLLVIPKAFEDNDGAPLRLWQHYGACSKKIFFNLLETDKKNLARFVYSQCNLEANNALGLAAKQGNMKATKLLMVDYRAYATNNALTTAVQYGFNDLATMLIKDHRADLPFVRKAAARRGDIELFDLFIELDPPEAFSLTDELVQAAIGGHITLFNKIITNNYSRVAGKDQVYNCNRQTKENNHSRYAQILKRAMA